MFEDKEIKLIISALQSADATSKLWHKDVYIMPDLSMMLAEEATGQPIEVSRYIPEPPRG